MEQLRTSTSKVQHHSLASLRAQARPTTTCHTHTHPKGILVQEYKGGPGEEGAPRSHPRLRNWPISSAAFPMTPGPMEGAEHHFGAISGGALFSPPVCFPFVLLLQSPIASVQRTWSILAGHSAVSCGTNATRMTTNHAIRTATQRTQGL